MNKWRHVYQNENNNNNKEWIGWINFWNIQHIQHTHAHTHVENDVMMNIYFNDDDETQKLGAIDRFLFLCSIFSVFFYIRNIVVFFFLYERFFRFITKLISLVLRWSLSIFFSFVSIAIPEWCYSLFPKYITNTLVFQDCHFFLLKSTISIYDFFLFYFLPVELFFLFVCSLVYLTNSDVKIHMNIIPHTFIHSKHRCTLIMMILVDAKTTSETTSKKKIDHQTWTYSYSW